MIEDVDDPSRVDSSIMTRLMGRALAADDPAAALSGLSRIGGAVEPLEAKQRVLRSLAYMDDIVMPGQRVGDIVSSTQRLLDSDLPPELNGRMIEAGLGASPADRARVMDRLGQLAERTGDPRVLGAVADRLNGAAGRNAMSPAHRADFLARMNDLADQTNALVAKHPQYEAAAREMMLGATDAHLYDTYIDGLTGSDGLIPSLRDYADSKASSTVQEMNDLLNPANLDDPSLRGVVEGAPLSSADHVGHLGTGTEGSSRALIDALQADHAARELDSLASRLRHLTDESIKDPGGLGASARSVMEDITTKLQGMDIDSMPPHLQRSMRDIIDTVRDFNRTINDTHTIIPGERRISDELYDFLRGKTPSKEIRDEVNIDPATGTRFTPPYPDPALPGLTVTKSLHADHIVSMDTIARMRGFELLTTAEKLRILNDSDNFIGLSETANTSKGSKSFEEWTTYDKGGIDVDPDFRDRMIQRERDTRGVLEGRIEDILAARGVPLPDV